MYLRQTWPTIPEDGSQVYSLQRFKTCVYALRKCDRSVGPCRKKPTMEPHSYVLVWKTLQGTMSEDIQSEKVNLEQNHYKHQAQEGWNPCYISFCFLFRWIFCLDETLWNRTCVEWAKLMEKVVFSLESSYKISTASSGIIFDGKKIHSSCPG